MNRIDAIFAELRRGGRKALMPFVTAGDPSIAHTEAIVEALPAAGASICELGIPFSDPIADGPVIQASMTHALDHGFKVASVFEMVARLRQRKAADLLGVVAMVSVSIVQRVGGPAFVQRAKAAGFDGFIFPDLSLEESAPLRREAEDAGLTCSMLIAPSTDDARAQRLAEACTGFVYVVSRAGITGERGELPAELPQRIAKLRNVTGLPIAVGFGVSGPDQVRQVVRVADAAIVGSAVVRRIAEHRDADPATVAGHVAAFTRELARGLA